MKKSIHLILFLFGILLFCNACKKNLCETNNCPPNSICNNGKCECDNAYKIKDVCAVKDANTYYYTGKSYYAIPDTFVLTIVKDPNKNQGNTAAFSYLIPFYSHPSPLSGGTLGEFFKSPSGDSIQVFGVFQNSIIKNKLCNSEISGRYRGTDFLDLTVRFFELSRYDITVDEHKITMRK